jgi:hypothetical protein
MRSRPPIVAALAAALAALAIAAAPAAAATITVETTEDSLSPAKCSWRDAIEAANQNLIEGKCPAGQSSALDVIDFNLPPESTITLTMSPPSITGATAIAGPGASQLTVSGGDAKRVVEIGGGPVTISGLTIAHGLSTFAGGIYNAGNATTLEGVVVTQSTAVTSGGLNAFAEGGGIYNTGKMTVVDSTIAGNKGLASGASEQNSAVAGGILNHGTLTIEDSTVRDNTAFGNGAGGFEGKASGAGISNNGTLNLIRSTVSGNEAAASGGSGFNVAEGAGLANGNAGTTKVTIDRSTISGNTTAATGPGASRTGGGVTVYGSFFSIVSSTIAANSAQTGANLAINFAGATVQNTILAQPLGGANCNGTVTSAGYNLTDASGCGLTQPTDQAGVDPKLSPAGLADNGGPTKTIALLEGSPAIDKGLSSAGEAADQRGLTRPVEIPGVANAEGGDGTDIGAFEVQLSPAQATGGSTQPSGASTGPIPSSSRRPAVTIKGLPATTRERSLKLKLLSSVPGASFRCKVDRRPYKPCLSPLALKGLTVGRHTLTVIATAGGVSGNPLTKKFRVLAARR